MDENSWGRRFAPAGLSLATGLTFAIIFGVTAYALAAAPALIPDDSPGGDLLVRASPFCGVVAFNDRPCFEQANMSVSYPASGTSQTVHMRNNTLWLEGRLRLEEARATIQIETDRGEWFREVFIPEEFSHEISIHPEDPKTLGTTEGPARQAGGYAFLFGLGGLIPAGLAISSGFWFFGGRIQAARITHRFHVTALIILGFLALFALISGSLGLAPALLIGWVFFLDYMTRNWIRHKEKWRMEEKIRALEESETGGPDQPADRGARE